MMSASPLEGVGYRYIPQNKTSTSASNKQGRESFLYPG